MKCGTRAELLRTMVDPFLSPAVLLHHILCAELNISLHTWEVELLWGGKNFRPCVLKVKKEKLLALVSSCSIVFYLRILFSSTVNPHISIFLSTC